MTIHDITRLIVLLTLYEKKKPQKKILWLYYYETRDKKSVRACLHADDRLRGPQKHEEEARIGRIPNVFRISGA